MTRQKIYDLIESKPGIHLSKIAETLSMRLSLVQYHLQKMEKEQRVVAVTDVGYYKRYYIAGSTRGPQERNIVSLLREPIPLQIVLYLLKHPNAKHKEILAQFSVTSATLSYHLNKLMNLGIVDAPLYAEDKGYSVLNHHEIISLLKKHRLIPLTQSFEDIWDDLAFK
jgi:predicted transcriptional regulator